MIRPYRETDLQELLDVWYRASLIAHPFLDDAFFEEEREAIATQYMPLAETWVYVVQERVVGFIAMLDDEVGGLFVDPDWQGQGIGQALLNHVHSSRPTLWLDVFAENAIARRFYARYGFEKVSEHLHEESGHRQLRLRLSRTPDR